MSKPRKKFNPLKRMQQRESLHERHHKTDKFPDYIVAVAQLDEQMIFNNGMLTRERRQTVNDIVRRQPHYWTFECGFFYRTMDGKIGAFCELFTTATREIFYNINLDAPINQALDSVEQTIREQAKIKTSDLLSSYYIAIPNRTADPSDYATFDILQNDMHAFDRLRSASELRTLFAQGMEEIKAYTIREFAQSKQEKQTASILEKNAIVNFEDFFRATLYGYIEVKGIGKKRTEDCVAISDRFVDFITDQKQAPSFIEFEYFFQKHRRIRQARIARGEAEKILTIDFK